jgi:hypothetical protein
MMLNLPTTLWPVAQRRSSYLTEVLEETKAKRQDWESEKRVVVQQIRALTEITAQGRPRRHAGEVGEGAHPFSPHRRGRWCEAAGAWRRGGVGHGPGHQDQRHHGPALGPRGPVQQQPPGHGLRAPQGRRRWGGGAGFGTDGTP